ncbi:hypothetical protein JKP88DRAFT_284635 [Tribonema minus]|uniref:Uncharacterized protein n=1 Tax=Tribonema minus TaxID=303371 RepID=A0A836CMQ7_9STRA|nr:hypothetical protein JKP88DRAFT_284635 [Tribonema minus]
MEGVTANPPGGKGSSSESHRLSFHGSNYVITTSLLPSNDVLRVEAETEDGMDRWWGDFASSYVEDISRKTGNFKRFEVFVQMLSTALAQRSDSVFVDLLTYADLEALKARRAGGQAPAAPAAAAAARANTKRYLILTYAVEFDRVHYPLPLAHEDGASAEALQRVVRRLREDLAAARAAAAAQSESGGAADALRQENAQLRAQVQRLEDRAADALAAGGQDAALHRQLEDAVAAYEQLRAESAREIRRLKREAKERQAAAEADAQAAQREGVAMAR